MLVMESNEQKDWEFLEGLLRWHLRINGKKNHAFIVGAFVDLLIGLVATSCSDSTSYSYAVSIKENFINLHSCSSLLGNFSKL